MRFLSTLRLDNSMCAFVSARMCSVMCSLKKGSLSPEAGHARDAGKALCLTDHALGLVPLALVAIVSLEVLKLGFFAGVVVVAGRAIESETDRWRPGERARNS